MHISYCTPTLLNLQNVFLINVLFMYSIFLFIVWICEFETVVVVLISNSVVTPSLLLHDHLSYLFIYLSILSNLIYLVLHVNVFR